MIETTMAAPPQQPESGLSIASLVLGVLSATIGCCCWLHIPLSIAAIITGIMGMQKVKAGTGGGYGMALAGVIVGGIVLISYTALAAIFGAISILGEFAS
ncbi:MAG: DUF4190 domain-containing protein [Planctomycetaceae bacterium]